MTEFINTVDVLGDDAVVDGIISRTLLTELKDDVIVNVRQSGFQEHLTLETVELPNLTQTNQYAFANCKALMNVILPKMTAVNGNVLNGTAVSRLVLPSVTTASTNAMRNNAQLVYVDLPVCTSLDNYVFANNVKMETLILRSETVCTTSNSMFYYTNNPITKGAGYIYVPRALVDSYKSATNWSVYAAQFRALEDYTVDGTITGELDETKI